MHIRDRVQELRRVKASDLRPNPRNWRTHPAAQQDALRGVLAEIGYAGALLARELPTGELELIDGHLRAETTPDALVPVLILDVNDEEAAKLLATFDPLSQLAETNSTALEELLLDVDTNNDAVQTMLDALMLGDEGHDSTSVDNESSDGTQRSPSNEPNIPTLFQIIVECDDEDSQRALFERLSAEHYTCRLSNL